ncbi:MAG TPA: fibronectin type III domain-containing protein [Solirubrobacteraceae bacterium]|jgi:hypothetical protein
MLTKSRGTSLGRAITGSLLIALLIAVAAGAAKIPAPSVSTGGTSNITYSTAILYGYINPHGQVTNYYFQYGPSGNFGSQSPLAPAGNATSTTKVSQAIPGLSPGLTYHYRIVAISPAGRTNGQERSFRTPKVPLSLAIVGAPNPDVFGSPFLVEGSLSGTGASTREIVLQANPFPYTAGFKTLGNPEVTNAAGGFSFPVLNLAENSQLRVMTVGAPVVVSPVVVENVAVSVTFHVRRTHHHGVVRFYGTVTPTVAGALVGFQLLKPGHKSVNQGGTVVKSSSATVSSFSRRVHLRHRGVYRALVKVANGAYVSAYSLPIVVR